MKSPLERLVRRRNKHGTGVRGQTEFTKDVWNRLVRRFWRDQPGDRFDSGLLGGAWDAVHRRNDSEG